jgi:hypothetical protein
VSVIRAFHGTSELRALSILADGFSVPKKSHSWLGTGVYFFQDNFDLAQEWATSVAPTLGDEPAVISAELSLDGCLDFAGGTWAFDELRSFHVSLNGRRYQKSGTTSRRFMDHDLLDEFCKASEISGVCYRSLRATFREGEPLALNSGLFRAQSITISVRDLSVIRGVEKVSLK